jgi:hypothetical protein
VIKLKELTNMKQIATTGSEFESLIDRVKFSDHALTKRNGLLPDGSRLLLKRVLETIYSEVESKVEAEELIDKILGQLVRSATPQH